MEPDTALLKDTPLKDTPLKDTPLKDTPLKDTPLKDTPLKDTPLKDTPRNDIASPAGVPGDQTAALDLDAIERDLADVEVALARLDAGTYWTDEVTGQPIDEGRLVDHPTARRAEG